MLPAKGTDTKRRSVSVAVVAYAHAQASFTLLHPLRTCSSAGLRRHIDSQARARAPAQTPDLLPELS